MSKIQHNYDFDPTHGFTLEQLLQVAAPPEPDDFADFWQQVYEQSLAGSKNYQIREIWSRLPEVKLFEVRFLSLDEKIITMWLSRPKVSYGAIVYGQGYGNGVWPIQDEYFTVCTVASRGLGPSTQLEIPWEVRQHVVHGIQSRDTYVWRGVIGDHFAATTLLLRIFPDCIENLNYRGVSMGGAIGVMTLAWDKRFRSGAIDIPTFGNHPLRVTLKCIGSGAGISEYYARHPECLAVLQYFDAAIAAKYVNMPIICSPAKFDPMVPPAGQFAIANSLPEASRQIFITEAGHFNYPADYEMRVKIDQAIHKLFQYPEELNY